MDQIISVSSSQKHDERSRKKRLLKCAKSVMSQQQQNSKADIPATRALSASALSAPKYYHPPLVRSPPLIRSP